MGFAEKRKDALRWLDRELDCLWHAPDLNGCPMTPEWEEMISVFTLCKKALLAYEEEGGTR